MSVVLGGKVQFGAPLRYISQPLLYIGFSKALTVCYVGETIAQRGILARWCAHLGAARGSDTFVQRLDDVEPDRLSDLVDLTVLYWVLDKRRFGTTESSCRRGVEYLVQRRLLEINGVDLRPALRLVANVKPNPTVRLDFVREAARLICDDFAQSYMAVQP